MHTQFIPEYELSTEQTVAIQRLLIDSFSGYPPGRIFFRQPPSFRALLFEGESLIAHVAVDYRVINQAGQPARIFGLGDVCVSRPARKNNFSAVLLREVEQLGRQKGIDFLVLLAYRADFYRKLDFQEVNNPHRWLIINRDQSLGLAQRRLGEGVMIKKLGAMDWKPGLVDLLGAVF